ncbi:hypothetical protein BH24CHL6_BH24CHL6_08350 [soil metagenome]
MSAVVRLTLSALLLAGCAGDVGPPSVEPSPAPTGVATPFPDPTPTARPTPTLEPARAPALPSPVPSEVPPASPTATPQPETFSINLYREGAFVSEYTVYYCLPAAMQTMMNIMSDGTPDTSRETQDRLYELAREVSGIELPRRVRDIEPEGWANGLNAEGFGPYEVQVEATLEDAIRLAARRLRVTDRPVGLLTWRGAHSWVMSGFEASADPLQADEFEVSGVWIQDVWWPRISTIWGESDPPNTLVPVELLSEDYLPYRRPYGKFPHKDGQFVLVVPAPDEPG